MKIFFENNALLRDKLLINSIFLTLVLAYVGFFAIIKEYSPKGIELYISFILTVIVFLFITYQNTINTLGGRTIGTNRKFKGKKFIWLGSVPILQGLAHNGVIIWLMLIAVTIMYGFFCVLAYFYGFSFLLSKLIENIR